MKRTRRSLNRLKRLKTPRLALPRRRRTLNCVGWPDELAASVLAMSFSEDLTMLACVGSPSGTRPVIVCLSAGLFLLFCFPMPCCLGDDIAFRRHVINA